MLTKNKKNKVGPAGSARPGRPKSKNRLTNAQIQARYRKRNEIALIQLEQIAGITLAELRKGVIL